MSKRQKLWHFIYFPDEDFLMSVGDPSTKSFEELVAINLSDEGKRSLREKDWKTFVIDSELTMYWREAHAIAANYFHTHNHYDVDTEIERTLQDINTDKQQRQRHKFEHSQYLKNSAKWIKRSETRYRSLLREKEKHSHV